MNTTHTKCATETDDRIQRRLDAQGAAIDRLNAFVDALFRARKSEAEGLAKAELRIEALERRTNAPVQPSREPPPLPGMRERLARLIAYYEASRTGKEEGGEEDGIMAETIGLLRVMQVEIEHREANGWRGPNAAANRARMRPQWKELLEHFETGPPSTAKVRLRDRFAPPLAVVSHKRPRTAES